MAVKKDKRPAVRYLLSADAKLRKLSMKKLAEERTKVTPAKRPSRKKAPVAQAAQSLQWPWRVSPGAIALAAVGVMTAVTLITAGQGSEPATDSTPVTEARLGAPTSTSTAPPARAEKPAPAVKPRAVEPVAKAPPPKPAPAAKVAAIETAVEDAPATTVTITGCLAQSKNTFTLKDASGAELARARSWKSGFFKKSAPRVELVPSSSLNLSSYVDQRVSATGVLADGALRARSIRRIASSCD